MFTIPRVDALRLSRTVIDIPHRTPMAAICVGENHDDLSVHGRSLTRQGVRKKSMRRRCAARSSRLARLDHGARHLTACSQLDPPSPLHGGGTTCIVAHAANIHELANSSGGGCSGGSCLIA